jgi:hypothetical protein
MDPSYLQKLQKHKQEADSALEQLKKKLSQPK